jgi:hypothetical protein
MTDQVLIELAARRVIRHLAIGDRKATVYISPTLTVKESRRHKPNARSRSVEIVLTIGRPNSAEREFIRVAKKAGEPFPIRKVQLRGWAR